jgi:hypothetical protein
MGCIEAGVRTLPVFWLFQNLVLWWRCADKLGPLCWDVQEFRTNMQAAYERCGFMGERVIGFAYRKVRPA